MHPPQILRCVARSVCHSEGTACLPLADVLCALMKTTVW